MAVSKPEIAAALGISVEAVDALAAFASREQTSGRSGLDGLVAEITGLQSIQADMAKFLVEANKVAGERITVAAAAAEKARAGSGTSIKPDEAKATVAAALDEARAAVAEYRQACADAAEKLAGVVKG